VEDVWQSSLKTLEAELRKTTSPPIRKAIIAGLTSWRYQTPLDPRFARGRLAEVVSNQDQAGWRDFFDGCPVQGWSEAHDRFRVLVGKRPNGQRWLSAIIRKMWDVSWDLWQHRNDVVHKKDETVKEIQANIDIREAYEQGFDSIRRRSASLVRESLEDKLKKPLVVKQAWLLNIRQARD
jgi:hypothetical protein